MTVAGPRVGVGAVLIHEGRVLLIKRGKEPLRGRWVVPGGTVELGETLEEAVVREVEEETGIRVRPREMLLVFDRIERSGPEVRYHYVIVDYLCEYVSGVARASSDAVDVAWVSPGDLDGYDVPEKAREVILEGSKRLRPRREGRSLPQVLSGVCGLTSGQGEQK